MALPQSPITNIEEPKLVKRPRPLMAKGQIPAYINAFGNPIITKNQIDKSVSSPKKLTCLCTKMTKNERINPKNELVINAFF